ncbi:winged helix-turn-helix transcriptional regulator [Nonomuraea zeae]|uniref:Transcriptional regulator n=1 Tax=Nonomuraea zeae TaxID=1642303 RepID=A0A5S4H9G9_9ACTN|nr:winged helix-turn-helix transcriptional regulator [Nonomuraea zeae]TMR35470.1 transcriptional regulator [Nonomuraea zeae]
MTNRAYGQFCGIARALEMVGERWALLIVRDLLVSPKRYTDLRNGLPKIPTNILAARLRELERNGLVGRRVLPRPSGAVVYELTEHGYALEDVVLALGRWGAESLGEPRPDEIVTADSLVMALRSAFEPEAAAGARAGFELRVDEVVVHAWVDDGMLLAAEGTLPGADLAIEGGPGVVKALMAGEITPDGAVEAGLVKLAGNERLLARFAEFFRIHG